MLNQIIVQDVKQIFTVFSPAGRKETIENRPTYGLSFCEEGRITYLHQGKQVVSDPSHAVILSQGETYSLRGERTGVFPVINFTCAGEWQHTLLSLPVSNPAACLREFEKLRALSLFEDRRAEKLSVFYHLLAVLSTQNFPCEMLRPAIRYLEKHYQEPELTNEALARECGVSEVYFRKLFVRHYRVTPRQYLIDLRMNRARQLLAEDVLKIGALAQQCGFSNSYHFCRLFKEKTALTPTEYRRQNRICKI